MAEKNTEHLTHVSILKTSQARIKQLAQKVKGRTIRAYMTELFNTKNTVIALPNALHKQLATLAEIEGRTVNGLIQQMMEER